MITMIHPWVVLEALLNTAWVITMLMDLTDVIQLLDVLKIPRGRMKKLTSSQYRHLAYLCSSGGVIYP